MKKITAIISATVATALLPLVSFAQTTVNNATEVGNLIVNTINNVLVPVIFAVAFIVFIWGAFNTFILGAQSEDTKEKGKNQMLWGLIGFFVMVSVWGLVNILTGTAKFGNSNVTKPTTQFDIGK